MYYLQDTQAPISAIGLYNDLCHRIITVELEPGTRISENSISAEYGVSRSVLRTVFARLQQINFVEVYPQRGTFVRLLDMDHVTSASTIRYVVERNAV
ncbi:MAG: GntR family transcriptional regulator, partial [Angelakisella sp.]